jgi:hypothetical protein
VGRMWPAGHVFETPALDTLFRLLLNQIFWGIFNPIQIHHKYVIGNPNLMFKMD